MFSVLFLVLTSNYASMNELLRRHLARQSVIDSALNSKDKSGVLIFHLVQENFKFNLLPGGFNLICRLFLYFLMQIVFLCTLYTL